MTDLDGGVDGDPAYQLGVLGFAALWRGERPAVATLLDDPSVVEAQVRAGRLEVDSSGVLVAVHGLAARRTRHRIEHDGGTVHTWCAFDAIGIPAALGIDAVAITSCPTCTAELRITLRGGEPMAAGPLSLWLPGGQCENLVEDFCSHANLFCNAEHLAAVVPKGSPGRRVTVAEAAAIGRQNWSDAAAAVDRSAKESH